MITVLQDPFSQKKYSSLQKTHPHADAPMNGNIKGRSCLDIMKTDGVIWKISFNQNLQRN